MAGAAPVFVDAGALYARVDRSDAHHFDAITRFRRLAEESARLVTSSLVVAETFSLLHRKLGYGIARRWLLALHRSSLFVLWPAAETQVEACRLLERFGDQDFSFTDAVSFAVMVRESIVRYVSFDAHFTVFGRARRWTPA